jgi:hypothetical protein
MSRSIVIIAAVAAIFAAGVLLSGRADAGASSSAPSKYAKASAGSSQSSAVRYGRGRWLTDFSSSARRR